MKASIGEIDHEVERQRSRDQSSGPHARPDAKPKRRKRTLVPAKTKAPARSSPEMAILSILSRSPASGIPTAAVLREVKEKWFPELDTDDLGAVYPESRKKVVDTVVKFARKHLVERGEIYAPGTETPIGTWKATMSGLERALKERSGWFPRYVEVHSLVEDEEAEQKEADCVSSDTKPATCSTSSSTSVQGNGSTG
ncbi:MAG: hypothetical protein OK457_04650 [Thaumarchaeota archaeon]|nr:hypothetical protein [Nitrososphaerota archaeon]